MYYKVLPQLLDRDYQCIIKKKAFQRESLTYCTRMTGIMINKQDKTMQVGSVFPDATDTICLCVFFMRFYDLYNRTHYVVYDVHVCTTIFYTL